MKTQFRHTGRSRFCRTKFRKRSDNLTPMSGIYKRVPGLKRILRFANASLQKVSPSRVFAVVPHFICNLLQY